MAHEYHATYCPCGGANNDDVEAVIAMEEERVRMLHFLTTPTFTAENP